MFHEEIGKLLEENELDKFEQIFYKNENGQKLNESSWELADLFSTILLTQSDSNLEKKSESIRKASKHLCTNYGNPKELLLIYLENCEYYLKNDERFLYFVDLIEILLRRTSSKVINYSLELALNEFHKYIKTVSKNNDSSLERLIKLIARLISFIQTFTNQNNNLIRFLINLFEDPFLDLNLEASLELFNLIETCYLMISKMNPDIFKLIVNLELAANKKLNSVGDDDEEEEEEEEAEENDNNNNDTSSSFKVTRMALSSFLNFVSIQQNKHNHFPIVYHPFYLLTEFLPINERLLNEPLVEIHLSKGLTTLFNLISRINLDSLDKQVFELSIIDKQIRLLFKIMVFSNYESIRKQSTNLFKTFYSRFDRQARFYLIQYYFKFVQSDETMNNYVSAYLIYLFKEELNNCFNQPEHFRLFNENKFELAKMFQTIIKLEKKAEHDLMQESTKIIAILNMIRFVLLRDKLNLSELLNLICDEKNSFMNDLEKAIQLSKAHYELELRNIKSKTNQIEASSSYSSTGLENKFQVETLTNEKIKEPTNDDKLKSLEHALQTFDLIESLRVRINEIIGEIKQIKI